MTKNQLIENIQNALQADFLNIGEDTFSEKPIHEKISKDEEVLIERIHRGCVMSVRYKNGIEQNTKLLLFDEISMENLHLILDNVLQANEFLQS